MSFCAPASSVGIAGSPEKEFLAFRGTKFDTLQHKSRLRVGGVEHAAVSGFQDPAVHLKERITFFRIAGHGLVENDIPGQPVLGKIGHIAGKIAVKKAELVVPFDADSLRTFRFQSCIGCGDIRSGINSRRTLAAGDVVAVFDDHGAAAPVAPDGGRAFSSGLHVAVPGIKGAAARGVQSSGSPLLCHDLRAGNISGPFVICKYTCTAVRICCDVAGVHICAAVRAEDCGANTVETCRVTSGRVTGDAGDIVRKQPHGSTVFNENSIFICSFGPDGLMNDRSVLRCRHQRVVVIRF